jgi:hypothetical protein
MASLFSHLFKYRPSEHRNPEEDFFTEIFAFLLENIDGLLAEILNHFQIIPQGQLKITGVETQLQLNFQLRDIRPDIFIRFSLDEIKWLLFIENKIGAREGEQQLENYLNYLGREVEKGTNCALLYITHFYDPKKVDPPQGVLFYQIRWWQIHEILGLIKFESDPVVFQARLYMKESGMSMSRNFSSEHTRAMAQWISVKAMMDESFRGSVEEKFKKINRGVKFDPEKAAQDLLFLEDYLYIAGYYFWIGIGYSLTDTIDKDYADVGGAIVVEPEFSKNRAQVIASLKEFAKKNDSWKPRGNQYDKKEAFWIEKLRSLKEFINSEDDIDLIQLWFLEILSDVEEFQKDYPQLKWD